MPRNERTSKSVASRAAKALKDPKATKREKSIAGSALTQVELTSAGAAVRRFNLAMRKAFRLWLESIGAKVTVVKPKRKAKAKRGK